MGMRIGGENYSFYLDSGDDLGGLCRLEFYEVKAIDRES